MPLPPHELIEVWVKHVLLNPLFPLELGLHTIPLWLYILCVDPCCWIHEVEWVVDDIMLCDRWQLLDILAPRIDGNPPSSDCWSNICMSDYFLFVNLSHVIILSPLCSGATYVEMNTEGLCAVSKGNSPPDACTVWQPCVTGFGGEYHCCLHPLSVPCPVKIATSLLLKKGEGIPARNTPPLGRPHSRLYRLLCTAYH